ncbi:hypothetical protein VNI00_013523 [Paramarasmius palmivorus]|uniref:Uncharacterized protein n=1 Tax=Paramarasmius palmivorus TaxID=297713 RepID=A0AAW0BWM4_9AGAR
MSQHAGDSTPPLTDGTKQKPKSNRTNTAIEISTMTLQVLKEAGDVSPFPGAGAIASLALEILTAVQNARENKDALKRLAYDAVAVATAVVEQFEEIKKKEQTVPSSLEKHTETLKSTMEVIREFTDSQRKRNRLQRIMSSKSDATLIQDYRQQLQQAMGLFGVQSNIDISLALERVEQLLLQQKISDFTESTVESPTAAPLLHTDASNTTTLPSSETPVTEDTTPTSNGAPKPSGCPSPSEFLIGESPAPCDTPSASGTSVPSENFIPSEIPIPIHAQRNLHAQSQPQSICAPQFRRISATASYLIGFIFAHDVLQLIRIFYQRERNLQCCFWESECHHK